MIGCAVSAPVKRAETTPALRVEWLRGEVARAEVMTHALMGAYLPPPTPGAQIVCSMAIQIDTWYGVGDERWELSKADTEARMSTVRPSSNMREELARIGIRDCVLDVNR
jgi:hypothetical protein